MEILLRPQKGSLLRVSNALLIDSSLKLSIINHGVSGMMTSKIVLKISPNLKKFTSFERSHRGQFSSVLSF